MLNITTYKEANQVTLEQVLEFMGTKSADEIAEFKTYCATQLVDKNGKAYTPTFFQIRKWVVDKYFPNAKKASDMEKTNGMLDKIMAL